MKLSVLFLPILLLNLSVFASDVSSSLIAEQRSEFKDPSFNLTGLVQAIELHAPGFKSLVLEGEHETLKAQNYLWDYGYFGGAQASYSQLKNPSLSPFAFEKEKRFQVGVENGYKFKSGVKTWVGYGLNSSDILINSTQIDSLVPDLNINFEVKPFQDLLFDKAAINSKLVASALQNALDKKYLSIKALLSEALVYLSQLDQVQNELSWQEGLCVQIRRQHRFLRKQKANGFVSARDVIRSEIEAKQCEIKLENLKNQIAKNLRILQEEYVGEVFVAGVQEALPVVLTEIEQQAQRVLELENMGDFTLPSYKFEKLQLSINQLEADSLDGETRSDLSLKLSAGLKGIDDKFAPSHGSLFDADYPYFLAQASMSWPSVSKKKKTELRLAQKKVAITEQKLNLLKNKSKVVFENLKADYKSNISNIKNSKFQLNLARKDLYLARKDFNNGKLNYNFFLDSQKNYIQAQSSYADYERKGLLMGLQLLDGTGYLEQVVAQSKALMSRVEGL